MYDNSTNGGFYFLLGALAVAVAVIFVVLSGHHALVGDNDQMRVETPHAALDLPQPPVMKVKYQSKICSPVQNSTSLCAPA
jgi:hypothetical protein